MCNKKPIWHQNIQALLARHGYDLVDQGTVADLRARTGLSEDAVNALLTGDRRCTIEDLCRLAEELNVPPGELLNISPGLTRIYAIDGSAPITVVFPPLLTKLKNELASTALFYASGLDGSYAILPFNCILICARSISAPEVNKLYLLESDRARFVRRCISINASMHEAVMTDDSGEEDKPLVVSYGKMKLVSAQTPLVMGTVLYSIDEH